MLGELPDRARVFEAEIEARNKGGPPVDFARDGIAFSELRSLDLRCKDVLERALPDYPELSSEWHVHAHEDSWGVGDVQRDLSIKKAQLAYAINLVSANSVDEAATAKDHGPLPKEYGKLIEPPELFFTDKALRADAYDKNVFIMTWFQAGNPTLAALDSSIRSALVRRGLFGHRADGRCYPNDRNFWDNVCTYMFGCKLGVAVLEDILQDEFNPNVALELGFMRALGKPTLLLKERRFKPRADILGTLWEEFYILDIGGTVPSAVDRWLDDVGVPRSV